MSDVIALLNQPQLTPLPGDADAVAQDAATYLATADAIDDALARMRAIASPDFSSDAVTALAGKQGEVAHDISRAWGRYRNVGDALATYAVRLRDAQEKAMRALAQFEGARSQVAVLAYPLQDLEQRAQTPGPDQPFAAGDLARLSAEKDQHAWAMQTAMQQWHEAVAEKAQAAKEAAIHVHRGNELDDLNDDFFDDIGDIADVLGIVAGFAKAVLSVVAKALTMLGTIANLLAMIIPSIGTGAAALFTMAQAVNLAVAVLSVLQSVLHGANVLDAAIAAIAVTASAAGAMLTATAAAATAAGLVRASAEFGVPIGGDTAQDIAAAGTELTGDVTDGLLSLGGEDAFDVYADARGAIDDRLPSVVGTGVGSAMGNGDRLTGWWARTVGLDAMPTTVLPGGAVAGAAGIGVAGGTPSAGGLAGFGEQPHFDLGTSALQEYAKVYLPQADGVAVDRLMTGLSPLNGAPLVGDAVGGTVQAVLGQHGDLWAQAAQHAVGGGTPGVSIAGGPWDAVEQGVRATADQRELLLADGARGLLDFDGGGGGTNARLQHWLGTDNMPRDPDGGIVQDWGKAIGPGFSTAIMARLPDGSRGDLFTAFQAHTPGHGLDWW